MSNRVRAAIICLVACVWAANFVAPIFVRGYVPSAEVHLVFMAVIAFLGLGYQHGAEEHQSTDKRTNEGPETETDSIGTPCSANPADAPICLSGIETREHRTHPIERQPHVLSQLPDKAHDEHQADRDRR